MSGRLATLRCAAGWGNLSRIAMKKILALPLLLLPSCFSMIGTFAGPFEQEYRVRCDDARAEIYLDGKLVGVGQAAVMIPRRQHAMFTAKLGNKVAMHKTMNGLSGWGIADAIGGWLILVPWIGLAWPGAWMQYPNDSLIYIAPQTAVEAEEVRLWEQQRAAERAAHGGK